MKPLFYFFGVSRKEKTLAITSPLYFKQGFEVHNFSTNNPSHLPICMSTYFEEYLIKKEILFGLAKSDNKLNQLFDQGQLLSPFSVVKKQFTIYTIPNKKMFLFKINRHYDSWDDIKEIVWKIIQPLHILPRRDFTKLTKEWTIQDDDCCDYNPTHYSLEKGKLTLSVAGYESLFITVKVSGFVKLRNKIKKVYGKKKV